MRKIKFTQPLVISAHQLRKLRIMTHIDLFKLSPCTIIVLKPFKIADVHITKARIMPDIKPLEVRIVGHINFFKLVIECCQFTQERVIGKIQGCQSASAAKQIFQLAVL